MAVTTADFASLLFSSRTQAHIFHLQTTFFSEHDNMNDYYDGIIPLVDDLIQACQGVHGTYTGYSNFELQDWISTEDTKAYFQELYNAVQTQRKDLDQASFLQNIIDEICQLIANTLYKLSLK
jgi:hypothetical protein